MRDAIGETNEMVNHIEQSRLFGYIKDSRAKELIGHYSRLAAKLSNLKDNWRIFKSKTEGRKRED